MLLASKGKSKGIGKGKGQWDNSGHWPGCPPVSLAPNLIMEERHLSVLQWQHVLLLISKVSRLGRFGAREQDLMALPDGSLAHKEVVGAVVGAVFG